MAAERTMEEVLQDVEKQGWVLSNLSCCGASFQYSCILERTKKDNNGFSVFAASDLCVTPKEALFTAWAEAQQRSGAPSDGKRKATPIAKTLVEVFAGRGAKQDRLRLRVAVANCISARTGEAVEAIL